MENSTQKGMMMGLGIVGGATLGTILIFFGIFFVCCACCLFSALSNAAMAPYALNDLGTYSTPSYIKYKEGDTISGIARKSIEDRYYSYKKTSQASANSYANSLKGSSVIWVASVTKVDELGKTIQAKINGDSVIINSIFSAYSNLKPGDLIKVSGRIYKISEADSFVVYIDATDIQLI